MEWVGGAHFVGNNTCLSSDAFNNSISKLFPQKGILRAQHPWRFYLTFSFSNRRLYNSASRQHDFTLWQNMIDFLSRQPISWKNFFSPFLISVYQFTLGWNLHAYGLSSVCKRSVVFVQWDCHGQQFTSSWIKIENLSRILTMYLQSDLLDRWLL